jgi:hypothetical protein
VDKHLGGISNGAGASPQPKQTNKQTQSKHLLVKTQSAHTLSLTKPNLQLNLPSCVQVLAV